MTASALPRIASSPSRTPAAPEVKEGYGSSYLAPPFSQSEDDEEDTVERENPRSEERQKKEAFDGPRENQEPHKRSHEH